MRNCFIKRTIKNDTTQKYNFIVYKTNISDILLNIIYLRTTDNKQVFRHNMSLLIVRLNNAGLQSFPGTYK